MLSKLISIISHHLIFSAFAALVVISGLSYYFGFFEASIPEIIGALVCALIVIIITELFRNKDSVKNLKEDNKAQDNTKPDITSQDKELVVTEDINAFERLSIKQKRLVCTIQNWSKESDIKGENGHYLNFNSNAEDPNAELTRLLNEAKQKGFEHKPKKA